MSHQPLHELWEAARDGELTAEQRQVFERHLRDHPEDHRLWDCETRWLSELSADRTAESSSDADFVLAVMERLDSEQRPSVLGRVRPWLGAAAAVAIGLMVWRVVPVDRSGGQTVGPPVAVQGGASDPLSILVMDLNRQVEDQPASVRSMLSQTSQLLSWNRWFDAVDPQPKSDDRPKS
jgi:hypothetical protein